MDFDPSQFLAMDMAEEPNSTYTAPDLAQPPQELLTTVEGGLELEQNMHIPVPVFGSLQLDDSYEIETVDLLEPRIEINETESVEPANTTPQPSPVERTASPQTNGKKIIQTTFEETRFRKDFYLNSYEKVKLFRLHCTICDKHLGCAPWLTERQMRTHKLLAVSVCRKCFEYYGDINFPIEDDSEIYCCWCGEGGEVFCCAKCPKTVCKKCIRRNFGERKIKEIEDNDNWICFVCNPTDIYPHRAMIWGLQRYSREMRQKVALLEKELKQKLLSQDSSHCCLSENVECPNITLPFKTILSKVPLCLIAGPHQASVMNQPDPCEQKNYVVQTTNNNVNSHLNRALLNPQGPTRPTHLQNGYHAQSHPVQLQHKQQINRGAINRSVPYPIPYQVNSQQNIHYRNKIPGAGQVPRRVDPNRSGSTVAVQRRTTSSGMHSFSPKMNIPERNKAIPVSHFSSPQTSSVNRNKTVPGAQFSLPQTSAQAANKTSSVTHFYYNDTPTNTNTETDINIDWLEKGVYDVNNTIQVIKQMLDQFHCSKDDLKQDGTRLTSFSDQFSHNIKIAICSLAKVNQTMVDARKIVFDNHVSSIVSNIKATVTNNPPVNYKPSTPQLAPPATNTPQGEEEGNELPGLNAALLCETVMEVEGNKENENSNKHRSSPVKKSKPNSLQKGRSLLFKKRGKPFKGQSSQKPIQVINLIDDDDDGFDVAEYCKKFKIKPCKVVLTRCK